MSAARCAPSSASSAALTAGCCAGVSRPYQAQPAISSTAGRAVHSSARCQSKADMSQAMSGGVRAAPRPSPMLCSPCTSGHWAGVNQVSKTPADSGKIGPWAAPSSSCAAHNSTSSAPPVSSSGASGVTTVAAKAIRLMMTNMRRAPMRWPSTPPGNCMTV